MDNMDLEGTRKRKRFSKNKKKYWKRHADAKDVEEFLEDQRLQERTGGLVAEKVDADLFFIDSALKEPAVDVSKKRRRREPKPLKCHSALLPDPKIKPSRIAHNFKKERIQTLTTNQKKKLTQKVILRSAMQAQRKRQDNNEEDPDVKRDLWRTSCVSSLDDVEPNKHYLRIMRITRPNTPCTVNKKPSLLPAVELAHPGASYNPEYDDHQELLQRALVVEERKLKAERRITRALDDMFPSAKDAPTELSKRNEMSEGLFDESDSDEDESDMEALSANPPVRREDKKTKTQRNKQLKQRLEKEQADNLKAERIRKNKIFRLKATKKEIQQLFGKQDEKAVKKKNLAEENKYNTKRLGKNKFEEPDLEIKLSHELKGSLRLLKPEGHLLEDRFMSLQKRNIIEPRLRARTKLKYKRKRFIKKSHKEVMTE